MAASRDGWATGSADFESIRRQARSQHWVEVPPRRGDSTVSLLRPIDQSAARPASLSAIYGLEQQPLHTDGAHLHDPPDVLLLFSQRPSATSTRLWRARDAASLPSVELEHGMFLVRNGRDSFYAPVLSRSRLRYDPGCMSACDVRAGLVDQYFERQLLEASTHEWSEPDQVLLIDNRWVLHARSAVAEDDMERELMRLAFRSKVAE